MSSHSWIANGGTSFSSCGVTNGTVGAQFAPNKAIRITSIHIKTDTAVNLSAGIRIYKNDGTLVASSFLLNITSPSTYVFNITAILLPTIVYRICIFQNGPSTFRIAVADQTSFSADGVTINQYPNNTSNPMFRTDNNYGDVFPPNTLTGIGPWVPWFQINGNSIAPNIPLNLSPAGTSGAPSSQATLTPTLSWSFTDPDTDGSQGAYQVIIKKASDNSIVKDTGKVTSGSNTYAIPVGVLQSGTLYYWTVEFWDNADVKNLAAPTAQYFRIISQPTISGNANEDLGNKNTPFAITYSVNDADSSDVLNVIEKLNGSQINTISNAPRNTNFNINITQAILNGLPLNQQNTIQISVTDGYSTTYRTITFTRINNGPTITNNNKDLGQVAREGISEKYICHDVEGNAFTIIEKVDDIELKNITGVDGTEYTISIPLNIWLALKNGVHTYTITATDSLGASTTRTFTFTKKETVIESTGLTKIISTDIAATKILLTPNWLGKENADIIVFQVCNNAYDANPTWEDATSRTLLNKPYTFTNKTKTATKWGIDIKFKISLKAGVTEVIEFYGIGGSLE